MRILSLDSETTGVAKTDQIVQLAYIELPNSIAEIVKGWNEHKLKQFPIFQQYYKPSVAVNPRAYEVHKLSDEFLASGNFPASHEAELPKDTTYIIGHNIAFDHRMLGKPEVNCICTIKLTKSIEKLRNESFGLENYQLGTVFKLFYPELYDSFAANKHNAIVDCYMSTLILVKLMEKFPFINTIEELYEYFYIT